MSAKRIQVHLDCSTEHKGSLWNNRNLVSQGMQSQFLDIHTVNLHKAQIRMLSFTVNLHHSEQNLNDCRFTSSCSSNTTDFVTWLDIKGQSSGGMIHIWPVFHPNITESNLSHLWPVFLDLFFIFGKVMRSFSRK